MEEIDLIKPLENINIAEVCRACFETCEQYKILFDEAECIDKRTLGDVFFDVVKIEMKANAETPPSRICLTCSNDLITAYNFIQKSQKNNLRLHQYLQNANIKKPDCLTEFPIDIPNDQNITNFLQIKVENEAIHDYDYNDSIADDDRNSPGINYDSDESDYEPLINKKEKIKKLECTYCNRIFKRQDFFENHMKKHKDEVVNKKEVEEESEDEANLKCEECDFSCDSKLEMKKHTKSDHSKTRSNATKQQMFMLSNFMEKHPELAKFYHTSTNIERAVQMQQWELLTRFLNTYGPPAKTVSEWRRIWTQRKYSTKKNRKHNKNSINKTGGDPCNLNHLDQTEEALIVACEMEPSASGSILGGLTFDNSATVNYEQPQQVVDYNINQLKDSTGTPQPNTENNLQDTSNITNPLPPKRHNQKKNKGACYVLKKQLQLQERFFSNQIEKADKSNITLIEIRDAIRNLCEVIKQKLDETTSLKKEELQLRKMELEVAKMANDLKAIELKSNSK